MTKIFFPLVVVSLVLFSLLGNSCLDYDNGKYAETESDTVKVKAFLTLALDSVGSRYKADTLLPTDSVIFIAVVEPTKSIRMLDYYWELDSTRMGSEFSFKTAIKEAGHHIIQFVLLDRFGDTLSDTLHLWISSPPILDNVHFIPINKAQGVDPLSGISFAWNATDTDPNSQISYHFSLYNNDSSYVDTILHQPYFEYFKTLPLSQKFYWNVSAYDEFSMVAKNAIHSTFYTKGIQSGSGIEAIVTSGGAEALSGLRSSLKTKEGTVISTSEIANDLKAGHFHFSALTPGDYDLFIYNERYPDYQLDTISFSLFSGSVLDLDTLVLKDTILPRVNPISSNSDSLPFADTLLFQIEDEGLPLSRDNISVSYNGATDANWAFQRDTLRIFFSANTSPLWQPLVLKVTDKSLNSFKHTYYLSPASLFISSLSDTTLNSSLSSLSIPIRNIAPNLTPERFFWDINADGLWDSESAADGASEGTHLFAASLFNTKTTQVLVAILYTNGILAQTSFKVTLSNRAPISTFAECITPCNIAASDTATTFLWHPASDADGDVLQYRVVYFIGSSATFTEDDWIYGTEASSDTTATVRNLPQGYIRWWVQAIDSEGATSAIWNPTSLVTVSSDGGGI
jgi:hypothetical protein